MSELQRMTKLNRQIERWLREIAKKIGPFHKDAALHLAYGKIARGEFDDSRKGARAALEASARETQDMEQRLLADYTKRSRT